MTTNEYSKSEKKYLWIYWIWVYKCTVRATYMNILNKRKNTSWIYWIWVKCIVRATYMNISNQSDKITSPSPPCRFQCSAAVLFFAAVHPGFQRLRRNGNLKTSADLWYLFPVDNLTMCYSSLIYRSLGRKPIPINPRHPFKRHTHCSQNLFTLSNKKIFEIPQFLLKLCTSGSVVNVLTSRNQARTCFKTSANLSLSIS